MCHFITATLPQNVDTEVVASCFDSHGRGFALISDPLVATQLDPGDRYILTTRKHCDCGTSLGTLARSGCRPPVDGDSSAREVAKLRRRGWSEAKIGRWQSQTENDRTKGKRAVRQCTQDAERWIDLLRDLLDSGATPRVALLLHWYRGNVESERISIRDRVQVEIHGLDPEKLMRMEEDVLYNFVT